MEPIEYTILNKPVKLAKIKSDYNASNNIYFSIEKTSDAEQVYFFNPEFAFEKQHLINADAAKIFSFLKTPQESQYLLQNGSIFIKIDNNDLNIFVRHIST